ncbi:MAG: efflux RND transporter periplasmic adaptor subunit [Verrucomicrobia bacterium]|nr:efflux RND transporter periplasmic adaptor subunit [Verrucomicrobiota bacterium]
MNVTYPRLSGVVVLALLTSCQRPAGPPPAAVLEVATFTVTRQPVLLTTELPGRTAAYRIAEIRPQVNGLIQRRLFTEGTDVVAGQDLYQIDPAPFRAALANAQAALGRSEASLPALESRADRFRQALADKAVSQQDFDDAEAALKQAQADAAYWRAMVESARINLGYARVVSPIAGRIGKSSVTDGAIVTAYQPVPLASIQQLDPMYVDVPQSTADLLRLRHRLEEGRLSREGTNGNQVQLVLGDGTRYAHEGTLQFRDVSVDPTTASVILRMVFPNPEGVLLPGMFVRAVVKEGVNDEAILIPQQTVSRDPKGNPLVLLVNEEGKVEQRTLVLDRALGDQWLVSSGLVPGDRVIAEGIQKVRPGVTVKAVPFEAKRPPARPPAALATSPATPHS